MTVLGRAPLNGQTVPVAPGLDIVIDVQYMLLF